MSPKEIVEHFYVALSKGEQENAYKYLDKHFTLKQATSLPYGGEYRGLEALADFFQKFNGYWKQFQTLATEFYEVGNKVFAVSTIQGRNHSNREIKMEIVQIYQIENQKIRTAQPFYFDTALILGK